MPQSWNPDLYNRNHSFVYHFGADLISSLAPQQGERILDVGCGSGQLTESIRTCGAQATGIDASSEMIGDARTRFPHVAFQVARAEDFRFDEPLDAVFSNAALHWVLDYRAAAKSIFGALRRGGRFVAEMGGKGNIEKIRTALLQVLADEGFQLNAVTEVWYFPSPAEYAAVLEEAGFTVNALHYYTRKTELASSERGIADWLLMFGQPFFTGIPPEKVWSIAEKVQELLRPELFENGKWYADYVRLRFTASKP
jgi:trans-aconitate methyltransferase